MSKKKLTIGLLVFIVGVMITACGSKSNNGNSANNGNNQTEQVPTSFDDNPNGCDDCVQTFNGDFRILDQDLYLEAFGYETGSNIQFGGGSVFEQVLGEVAIAILEPAAGVAVCAGRIYLTEAIAELAGIDNVDIECTTQDLDLFSGVYNNNNNGNQQYDLRDNYPCRMRVQYENGRATAIEMTVASNLGNGDDVEVFYLDRSNIFVNRENTLILQNDNGRVRFGTTGGELIGEYRD